MRVVRTKRRRACPSRFLTTQAIRRRGGSGYVQVRCRGPATERCAQSHARFLRKRVVHTWRDHRQLRAEAASLEKDEFPAEMAQRLPHCPVPAAVIGRLAIDRGHQGCGIGDILLLDAIRRVVRASDAIGVYAVVVDARNDHAAAFYERYGFRSFPSTSQRLFLPLRTFEKLGL